MDRWAGALYGDPCRECAFAFSIGLAESLIYLEGVPDRYADLLVGANGTERHPDLSWSVGSYVCHVTDNLRIWAERLAGSTKGVISVAPYDQNLLAQARSYADIPLHGALWALGRGGADWQNAVTMVEHHHEVVVVHRERGEMGLEDVARGIAHDASHHAWDIHRSLHASQ
jgi:hypothetical protein